MLVESAVKLHGHLGPFLVIGVQMGDLAKRHLKVDDKNSTELQATIKTPLSTPFSCIIDGVQVSTSCTVGNQKLKIETSDREITARFNLRNSKREMNILVNPKVVDNLIKEMSKGVNAEQLAAKIVSMKEEQLFVLEKQNIN